MCNFPRHKVIYRRNMPSRTSRTSVSKRELLELRKDRARLDWLADRDNKVGNVMLPVGAVMNNLHSMRDAIDAAMTGDYPKQEPIVEQYDESRGN